MYCGTMRAVLSLEMELFPHPYSCTSHDDLGQGADVQAPSVLHSHTWADLILLRNGTKPYKLYSLRHYETISIYKVAH